MDFFTGKFIKRSCSMEQGECLTISRLQYSLHIYQVIRFYRLLFQNLIEQPVLKKLLQSILSSIPKEFFKYYYLKFFITPLCLGKVPGNGVPEKLLLLLFSMCVFYFLFLNFFPKKNLFHIFLSFHLFLTVVSAFHSYIGERFHKKGKRLVERIKFAWGGERRLGEFFQQEFNLMRVWCNQVQYFLRLVLPRASIVLT